MENLIALFVATPLLGFVLSLVVPATREKLISWVAFTTTGITMVFILAFIVWWGFNGFPTYNIRELTIYSASDYTFFIDLYFDEVSAVYLAFSSILAYLIAIYSRYYLHREPGYKRFFNTKLLFVSGINLIILAGNFETLFLGWEVLGISSFLLIGYYRERYLPVRNALKVYSIYRIADIGILLAMWLSHHLWHENITFVQLNDTAVVQHLLNEHWGVGLVISWAIVVAAAAKSAQFPFSGWLPRAMEGPTPSSAIFYGSVAVHIGVFLLIRTFPFWESQWLIRALVIFIGLATSFLAIITSKSQTSVKAQIAYSSVAQIGIIFIEVALGLEWLALIHMTGNAFLRSYQLLISPSVVTYLIREQFFNFQPAENEVQTRTKKSWKNTLFVLGLREWDLDSIMYTILWKPMKKIGDGMKFMTGTTVTAFSALVFVLSIYLIQSGNNIPAKVQFALPEIFGVVAVLLVVKALAERKKVFFAWELVTISHLWIALAVGFNESFDLTDTMFYLSGVLVAGISGYYFLHRLKSREQFDLNSFYGHIQEHKWLGFGFLLSCLALAGFPITTTFLGEDLLFTHIHDNQVFLAWLVSINFIIEGLALMRMYTRIFLGPHKKNNRAVPLRNA